MMGFQVRCLFTRESFSLEMVNFSVKNNEVKCLGFTTPKKCDFVLKRVRCTIIHHFYINPWSMIHHPINIDYHEMSSWNIMKSCIYFKPWFFKPCLQVKPKKQIDPKPPQLLQPGCRDPMAPRIGPLTAPTTNCDIYHSELFCRRFYILLTA